MAAKVAVTRPTTMPRSVMKSSSEKYPLQPSLVKLPVTRLPGGTLSSICLARSADKYPSLPSWSRQTAGNFCIEQPIRHTPWRTSHQLSTVLSWGNRSDWSIWRSGQQNPCRTGQPTGSIFARHHGLASPKSFSASLRPAQILFSSYNVATFFDR